VPYYINSYEYVIHTSPTCPSLDDGAAECMKVFLNAPSELPIVVNPVVPLPVTVNASPIVTSSGRPIVTVAFSLPEPETEISLEVPDIPDT
jgi:hypothetical protein